MSAVPERDQVDRCFAAAHEAAKQASTNPQGVEAIVYALEGLAHQVRDADDTQFAIKGTIMSGLADLGVIINGRDDSA